MSNHRAFITLIIFAVWILLALPALSGTIQSTGRARESDRPANDDGWFSATALDNSGNVYMTGPASEILGEGSGHVTAKYDNGGSLLWVTRYDDPYHRDDLTGNIKVDSCGNVYVKVTDGKNEDFTVICYSPVGDKKWMRTYNRSAEGLSEKIGDSPVPFSTSNRLAYEEGWPVILSGGTNQNVAAADIDNDGMVEIVVSEFLPPIFGGGDGHIYVFRYDGSLMEPWPEVDLEPYGLNPRSVSMGDLDNDGDLEIVFAAGCTPQTPGYTVYIFHHDGTKVTDGWPKAIGGFAPVSPILEDIDNDGFLEIIGKDGDDKISAWNFDGSDVPGWPFVFLGAGPINYTAVGDVNGDGEKEVVAVQSSLVHHDVYVISGDGQLLSNWYISDDILGVTAFPSLADLDKDGDLEILLYDCTKVHAYHHDGVYVNGWPALADYQSGGGHAMSIGDLNGDQYLEVAARSYQSGSWFSASVWRNDGNLQEGWPVTLTGIDFGYASSIGNINNDDEPEVLVTAHRYYGEDSSGAEIYAFSWNGVVVDGFPFPISDIRFGHVGNIVLQDTDQDDTVEAVFAMQTASPTDLFMVGVLNLSAPYVPLSMDWPMFQRDPRRTGTCRRGTIYVDDDNTAGPWHGTVEFPYQYIQDGIDDANPLDEILISNGTYYENVVANKPVLLIGEDSDSTVIDAGGAGPGISITADLVTIRQLTIQGGDGSGIHVGSDNNVILRNNIRDNSCGILITSFDGNRIYHNNFFSNSQNAHDGGHNVWDNGYPSGGNYWDDYSGVDVYWGPSQDVPGSDGVGDTPYLIGGGDNQDRYPLMSPLTDSLPIPPRDTVYVDDDYDQNTPGWGWIRFDKIQDALDTVVSEGVVYVANGTYYEKIRMDKTMHLIGEDRDSTVIDGGGGGSVVGFNRIQGASFRGFTVRNGRYGIVIGYDTFNNTVSDNIVTDNEDVGILLSFSSSTTLCNNVIANTAQRGISLMSATGNLIIGNTFRGNRFGIYSDVSFGDSQIYHNDFLNNIANACDWEENIWDNGYPSGGNYWSNFDQTSEGAYDDDGDGIADSACSISCGDNQDRYPFMNPHHTPLIPGDANKDWLINTGDVIYLINYLFRDGPAPDPLVAGDCDGDGVVGTGDVVYLLNYLFRGGPPPTC